MIKRYIHQVLIGAVHIFVGSSGTTMYKNKIFAEQQADKISETVRLWDFNQ